MRAAPKIFFDKRDTLSNIKRRKNEISFDLSLYYYKLKIFKNKQVTSCMINKNKKNSINIKLITITLLTSTTFLILSAENAFSNSQCIYNSGDSNRTILYPVICNNSIGFAGLSAENVLDIQFGNSVTVNENNFGGINFNNSTGTFAGDVEAKTNGQSGVYFTSSSTGTFGGNVTANENDYNGIYFSNNSTGTFEKDVEANNNFNGIEFYINSTGTFNGNVTANENDFGIYFSNNSIGTFEKDVEATTNGQMGIVFSFSIGTFNGNVTANENSLHGINFSNSTGIFEKDVEVKNNGDIGIEFYNSTGTFNGSVTAVVNTNKDIYFIGSVGEFNGNVTADSFHITSASGTESELIFGDGIELTAPVTTENAYECSLEFLGGVTINKNIGSADKPLRNIVFNAGTQEKIVNFNDDIASEHMVLGSATYRPSNNVTLNITNDNNSVTELNNLTFDLGANTLKFGGGVTYINKEGDENGKVTINTMYDGSAIGHVEMVGENSSIDLTNSDGLVINITDAPNTPLPAKGETREVGLVVINEDGTLALSEEYTINNLNNESNNQLVEWTFNSGTGILSQKRVENSEEVIKDIINDSDQNNNIDNLPPETEEELENIAANEGSNSAREALERLTNTDAVAIATAPVTLATQDTTQVISNRASKASQLLQLADSISVSENGRISGVSSGEVINKYGVWTSPFYGENRKRSRNKQPGYKSTYYGGIIGIDSLINDYMALGIAFSYMHTNINHKDINKGDKTKVDSYIISGYGTYEITDKWFGQGVVTVAHSRVNNREIRKEFKGTSVASAKYNMVSWGGELLIGYNQKLKDNLVLTPFFGVEYNRLGEIKYQEKGTRSQNLIVRNEAKDRLDGIVGLKASGRYKAKIGKKEIVYIPEIHGNIRYGKLGEKSKLHAKLSENTMLSPRTAKRDRAIYHVGGSITSRHNGKWEYSLGYNLSMANKYLAHLGTLKLRLNF